MARNKDNIVLHGLSGKLGLNLIVKSYAYGEVISKRPDMSKVKPSSAQQDRRALFKEAISFAKSVVKNPDRIKDFKMKLKKGRSFFRALVSRYMKTGQLTNDQLNAKDRLTA